MKILCSCRNMNHVAGGVEKALSTLMHELLRRGHDIALVTWDREDAIPFYALDPRISWHKLAIGDSYQKAGWKTRWQRAMKVRDIVRQEKPDIILTFQNGAFLSLWAYTLGMGVPVVVSERNAPTMYDYIKAGRYKFFWTRVYGLSPLVVIQTESQKKMYPSWLQRKIEVISNPVFPVSAAKAETRNDTILCVGRLDYQKNQIVLLRAFKAIAAQAPSWKLVLVGDGKDRAALESFVAEHGLASRVSFIGNVQDVTPYYLEAGIFCLPSRWEGFPNTLAEAMSCGAPSVGFSECSGVNDLIADGRNGLLAPGMNDENSLADALLRLINDAPLRARMSQAATSVTTDYKPDRIFDRWEQLLRDEAAA